MIKILLVDDDPGIIGSLGMYLTKSGFLVQSCTDGNGAVILFQEFRPDLVILDINLPGKDGIRICREIRQLATTPILMLSARNQESDRLSGFDMGADDYVSKPFSPREIVARINTILKRGKLQNETPGVIHYKDLILDENDLLVRRSDRIAPLTKSEFFILKKLVEANGNMVLRRELMEDMGYSNYLYDRTIDTHIKNLRKKIGEDLIQTVRGMGYKCV